MTHAVVWIDQREARIVLAGVTWPVHQAECGEYVTQVTAIAPLSREYRRANDDLQSTTTPNPDRLRCTGSGSIDLTTVCAKEDTQCLNV
jgi:hypothetical protein